MSVLIFIAVIVVLIVAHEFGHFIAAKWTGMRVDEFGIGYPPRALTLGRKGETTYTLNWLPFGGFVKIFGEDGTTAPDPRAFSAKPKWAQALVLVAGVAMNMVLAYVLITGALIAGTPRALAPGELAAAKDAELLVANVLPESPAAQAGLRVGDVIVEAEDGHYQFTGADPAAFTKFVAEGNGQTTVALSVRRGDGSTDTIFARPAAGVVAKDPSRPALGVEVAAVGIVPVSVPEAITEGAVLTWEATKLTAVGLWNFFAGVFMLNADLSQVAGPVGIAGAVGSASAHGFGNLFSIMALISINLALINLLPVPALDGGRLLFVLVESIIRRPIKPEVAQALNAVGFLALILLMLIVTAHDIFRLVA